MIYVLSDEQLEQIEDALQSAFECLPEDEFEAHRLGMEIHCAQKIVQAARALMRA